MPEQSESIYRRGGALRYIEKPNKAAAANAMDDPPIQAPKTLGPITQFIVGIITGPLPLSKVVEVQKQSLNAPVVWKMHTNRMPIAEMIATHFPNHRQMTAPAF